ncbi:hypothetical protein CDAR_90661 [Caerostris darwini]|uniref:Uncharacterized protein n=1 Tax=Caerostris darwini TaxID=1538125 RepID=A0AAV4SXI3_9ARAC|nr:hypothetical protein CDAR_90661 [Caerostris darwini]
MKRPRLSGAQQRKRKNKVLMYRRSSFDASSSSKEEGFEDISQSENKVNYKPERSHRSEEKIRDDIHEETAKLKNDNFEIIIMKGNTNLKAVH